MRVLYTNKSQNERLALRLSFFVLLAIFFSACKHETKFAQLNEVSYSTSIAPIINANCAYSGCHGNVNTQSFNGLTYDGLMKAGVKPGKPKNSKLYTSLVSLNSEDMMPQSPYQPLSDKQIQLIYVWIGQGAKNN